MSDPPLSTPFTELVGCELPVQLAPAAGVCCTPDLPVAVAEAGGHAMVPAVMQSPAELAELLDEVMRRTRVFGVNFIAPLLDRNALECALERAPLVDFFLGRPDPALIEAVHDAGALAGWQVGSVEDAVAAAGAGCDVVIAQGIEAGGRHAGGSELAPLLDGVLDAIDVPVLAAGGIGSRGDVAAALAAGAAGVRIGTRFIASEESAAHPAWKAALTDARGEDAVVTRKFAVGIPDIPHRVLRCSLEAAEAYGKEYVGEVTQAGRRVQVPRFASNAPTYDASGAVEAMPFYAGRSVGAVDAIRPAREIVNELMGSVREGAPVR